MSESIVYIAGWGRSGTTILGAVLGQVDGLTHVGELNLLWEWGLEQDRTCGCGRAFSRCEFWRAVLDRAYGGPPGVEVVQTVMSLRKHLRLRMAPLYFAQTSRQALRRRLQPLIDQLRRLYEAVFEVSGAEVVVDSSKYPLYGLVVSWLPEKRFFPLHVVRHPAAVAHSWRRRRNVEPDGIGMDRQGPFRSALMWLVVNNVIERLWSSTSEYSRAQYEQFVAAPRRETCRLARMVGADHGDDAFVSDTTILIDAGHAVAGNPARFRTGEVSLADDREWRTALGRRTRITTNLIAGRTMRRYGYS